MQAEELVKSKQERDKRLKQQAAKEWREIDEGTLMFERKTKEILALQSYTRDSIASYIQVSHRLTSLIVFQPIPYSFSNYALMLAVYQPQQDNTESWNDVECPISVSVTNSLRNIEQA